MSPSILLVAILSGQAADPCQDASYLELRGKTLSAMTETERSYYLEKDRFCRSALQRGALPSTTSAGSSTQEPAVAQPSAKEASAPSQSLNHRPAREASSIGLGAIGGFMAGLAALILVIRIVTL